MSDRIPLNEHAAQAARTRRIAAEDLAAAEPIASDISVDPQVLGDAVNEALEKRRRERRPFGAMEQKLLWPNRPGYHRHWFNDEPGRLLRAKEAGYEPVLDDKGAPVCTVVGIGRGGHPLTAYLHEIPQEWFDEDMAAQEGVVMELKRQIERGDFQRPSGADGRARYAGEISIRESTRR